MRNLILNDIKGVIFDFDGTLVDSTNQWSAVYSSFLARRNVKFNEEKYLQATSGMSLRDCVNYTIK